MNKRLKFFKIAALVIISNGLGSIGTLATRSNLNTWYAQIDKPFFTPPNWVFGPAWTTLFTLMAISVYFIWESKKSKKIIRQALSLFIIQFIFNITWSFVFFGLKNPGLAFINIIFLLLFIILTLLQFEKIDKKAGYLLLPYLFWVSFASMLNMSIWLLNS